MNCCDEYGDCRQGRDCPVRKQSSSLRHQETSMSKEAMKLALEALEDLIPLCDPGFSVCYDVNKAITALREALAKPDFWEGYVPEPVKSAQQALDKKAENARELGLDYEPAQQEPVAWMELLREARDNCKASIVEEGISASRKEYRIDLEARLTAALNTSPPAQRTWVGLTDEEIQTEWVLTPQNDRAEGIWFGRRIEAKLKEKNT